MIKIFYTPFLIIQICLKQLWLSVSSVKFYQEVCRSYTGYGLKYIFYICFLSSLFLCCVISVYLNILKDSFNNSQNSPKLKLVANFEYILDQMPDVQYNGVSINTGQEDPVYIKDIEGNLVAIIDASDKLSVSEKTKSPIIFTYNSLLMRDKNGLTTNILYSHISKNGLSKEKISKIEKIIHNYPWFVVGFNIMQDLQVATFTKDIIKKELIDFFNMLPRMFLYFGFPLITIMSFVSLIIENLFIIALVYLVAKVIRGMPLNIQGAIRVVMFSSGVQALVHPLALTPFVMLWPQFISFWSIVSLWANILLIYSIIYL